MYPKVIALALGVALTFGAAASEARAASECALSIGIFGISIDVCADADTNTSRERHAARNREDENIAVGVVDGDRSGTCNVEAHNTQGEVEPGGQDVNVTMAICAVP
jgi:hypothetical protein